jgi:hypothetical protein
MMTLDQIETPTSEVYVVQHKEYKYSTCVWWGGSTGRWEHTRESSRLDPESWEVLGPVSSGHMDSHDTPRSKVKLVPKKEPKPLTLADVPEGEYCVVTHNINDVFVRFRKSDGSYWADGGQAISHPSELKVITRDVLGDNPRKVEHEESQVGKTMEEASAGWYWVKDVSPEGGKYIDPILAVKRNNGIVHSIGHRHGDGSGASPCNYAKELYIVQELEPPQWADGQPE